MSVHISTTAHEGLYIHAVHNDKKYLGAYWKNKEGDWEVELISGIGWDCIDSPEMALEMILENS